MSKSSIEKGTSLLLKLIFYVCAVVVGVVFVGGEGKEEGKGIFFLFSLYLSHSVINYNLVDF